MITTRNSLCILFILFFASMVTAQDISSIGKSNPLTVSGGINLNQIAYGSTGIDGRRDPYSFFFTGSLNFNLYGLDVPLSFSVSNQSSGFQQPFNQYGIAPTYKWVTAYLGYNALTFSPYTLNGHIFNGVGVELKPEGKFSLTAMYGRLLKAVEPDTLNEVGSNPSYKRMGFGFKASYKDEADYADLIFFSASDQINSISYVPEELDVLPEDNLVLGLNVGKLLFQRLMITAEVASSALTRDKRSEEIEPSGNLLANLGPFFTQRASSSFNTALKGSATYKARIYSIGMTYERIDPEYETLGAYFFNNDLENITGNVAVALLGGRVNLGLNAGSQRNNLGNTEVSSTNRFVGSLNVAYNPGPRLNMSGTFSNFQTFTNVRSQFVDINQLTPFDNLDTLDFTQIARSGNVNMNYIISQSKERSQNLNINLNVQTATDEQGGVEQASGSQFINLNSAYSLRLPQRNLSLTASFNFNRNEITTQQTTTLGPTIAIGKQFLEKKLRNTLSVSWNKTFSDASDGNRVLNVRLNSAYRLKDKHRMNASVVFLNRNDGATAGFSEYTVTVGYSYNFSTNNNSNR